MKNSRISILKLVISLAVCVLFLCGCSGTEPTSIAFSETLQGEEPCIWYECQNKLETNTEDLYSIDDLIDTGEDEDLDAEPVEYGRETRVIWIKVYDQGKLTTYSTTGNVYLGHFAKMTDEEIIKELESDDKTYIPGQKDEPYEIYLYTDAKGQEVVFEGVPSLIKQSKKDDPLYYMVLMGKDQVPTFQVYDAYYGGYVLYNYDETTFGEAVIITRCEESDTFGLDGMELEGAVLDYLTPEDMLHEKNAELRKQLTKEKAKKADEAAENKQ